MPNHVTNKLIFDAADADRVISYCCPDGKQIDFELLVPSPPHMYQACTTAEDEKDFPLNWRSWSCENWGTKWNAYGGSVVKENDGRVSIKFDTAWSLPRQIAAAIANRFKVAFEHRYFDEGHNFWGVETWGLERHGGAPGRLSHRKNASDDKKSLCIELKGYDPDAEEEDT